MRLKILLLAAMALALTGCEQVAEKAFEQATGIKVDQKGESVTIKGKDGEEITFGTNVPDDLKDFPVPQGFSSDQDGIGSLSSKGGEEVAVAVWKGKTTVESVADFYKKSMPEKGWQEASFITMGDGFQGTYTKSDAEAVVTATKEDEDIEISVLYSKGTKKATSTATTSSSAAGSGSTTSEPMNTPAVSQSAPTATPKPQPTPTPAAPQTSDTASVPQELKSIPVPNGFKVVKDSVNRLTEGGVFKVGAVIYFGTMSVEQVTEFYTKSMANDWNSEAEAVMEEEALFEFVNKQDDTLRLAIVIAKTETGTEISMMLVKE
ncbi:MAG: hypothetical protein ACOX87_08250 [Chloroflexota bacterium]